MTRVWVTRDEPVGGPLAGALAAVGLVPVSEPVLETRVVSDAHAEVAALGRDDWLVLTSPRAIRSVAAEPARTPRVAVVGEVSAALARGLGMRVELVGATGDGAGLWDELAARAAGRRVCFPRSSLSEVPVLAGAVLTAPVLYEVGERDFDRSVVSRVDAAAFASPSAVASVLGRLPGLAVPMASLGPTTSAAIRRRGARVAVEAATRSFESLAAAIATLAERR